MLKRHPKYFPDIETLGSMFLSATALFKALSCLKINVKLTKTNKNNLCQFEPVYRRWALNNHLILFREHSR